jgi:hypothetical protein
MCEFGSSVVISASHCMLPPAMLGALAIHRDFVWSITRTDSRCDMMRGRFSKLRQKAYSSSRGLLIKYDAAICTPGRSGRVPVMAVLTSKAW